MRILWFKFLKIMFISDEWFSAGGSPTCWFGWSTFSNESSHEKDAFLCWKWADSWLFHGHVRGTSFSPHRIWSLSAVCWRECWSSGMAFDPRSVSSQALESSLEKTENSEFLGRCWNIQPFSSLRRMFLSPFLVFFFHSAWTFPWKMWKI